MTEHVRTPDVGQVLREFRMSHTPRMTQAQLAELLNVDQSHISRIEKGEQKVRSIDFLWRIVRRLGVEPRRLGISSELIDVMEADAHEDAYQAAVAASHQQWLGVRQHLNQHRSDLAGVSGGNCQSSLGPPGARVWLGTSPEPRRGRRRRA
jgi:transcriptional regulator with XRE-family HTH domain